MASRKWICSLVIGFVSLFSHLGWAIDWGTEFLPWVPSYLEFDWRQTLIYQTYSGINSSAHCHPSYSSDDFFITHTLSGVVQPELSLAAEATLARTRRQSWSVDHIRLQGRYMWLDDIVGDPISLTTGVNFTQAFKHSLHDISSFHHGTAEAELFLSFGKETSQGEIWMKRWWGVLGIGSAVNRGSPWLRGRFAYEWRTCQNQEWRLFIHSLCGLGHRPLVPCDFHGYSSVQHQSIDVGGRYTYLIDFVGSLSVEYAYRVHARNFPAHTHYFLLSLFYPL